MKFHYEIKLSLQPHCWEDENIRKYITHALECMGDFEADVQEIRLVRKEQAPEHPMMERMGRLLLQRWFIAPCEERTTHGVSGLMEALRCGYDFVITPDGERQPFIWPEEVDAPTKSLEEIDDEIEACRLAYESIVYGEAHPSWEKYTDAESRKFDFEAYVADDGADEDDIAEEAEDARLEILTTVALLKKNRLSLGFFMETNN